MTFSEDERRELDRLQRDLKREDPRLASKLRGMYAETVRASLVFGLVMLVTPTIGFGFIVLGVRTGILACTIFGVTFTAGIPILACVWLRKRSGDRP